MPTPKRACIYVRTSSERQGEKVSPETQLTDCAALAQTRGYTVVTVYRDTEKYRARGRLVEPSGTRVDRPAFTQLLADARAGAFDVILAWKEDRLYRGVKPAVLVGDLLDETRVTLELAKETFDHKMLYIKAAIGRLELESMRERTMMGMAGRARDGLHHGGAVPHGYRPLKDRDGRTLSYEMDPAWRWFFDELALRFLRREPYHVIAASLGTSPHTGRPWLAGSIRNFIRNPFYRGQIAPNWRTKTEPDFVARGVHAPAWDEATCAAIEREYRRRAAATKAGPRLSGPFSGLVRCGICGYLMAVTRSRQPRKDGSYYEHLSYGCYRPAWVRTGAWHGRTHEPNFIAQPKLLKLVRAIFGSLTVADVDEYLAGLAQPSAVVASDRERLARLQADEAALSGTLADLTVGLNGIRQASPAAAEAILAEMRRVGKLLDAARDELLTIEQRQAAQPDPERIRAAFVLLVDNPTLFDRPPGEWRPILQEALPALYVKGGGLVDPVPEWTER